MSMENYSLLEIFKMKGVGSARVIAMNNTKIHLLKDNRLFTNFMITPVNLVIIQKDNTLNIKSSQIDQITFIERSMKVKYRYPFGYRTVFDAVIEIHTQMNVLKYYVPVQSFKSLKKFFIKDWLELLTVFKYSNKKIEGNNPYILNSILEILKQF